MSNAIAIVGVGVGKTQLKLLAVDSELRMLAPESAAPLQTGTTLKTHRHRTLTSSAKSGA